MKKKQKEKLKRIIISTVLFLLVYLSSLILNALNVDFIPNKKILWIIPLIIYLSIYVYAGYDVYYKAYLTDDYKETSDPDVGLCYDIREFVMDKIKEKLSEEE